MAGALSRSIKIWGQGIMGYEQGCTNRVYEIGTHTRSFIYIDVCVPMGQGGYEQGVRTVGYEQGVRNWYTQVEVGALPQTRF